jgi:hypothetical protein
MVAYLPGSGRASGRLPGVAVLKVAPAVGLEPTTKRLTAARSTTELRRSEGRPGGQQRRRRGAGRKDSIAILSARVR